MLDFVGIETSVQNMQWALLDQRWAEFELWANFLDRAMAKREMGND